MSGYEHAAGFDVPGAYAGLVLDHFNFGDLIAYLTGQPDSAYSAGRGVITLLGCDRGEVGCWTLESQVLVENDFVTWRGFAQPFRPRRDYGSFGLFTFRKNLVVASAQGVGHLALALNGVEGVGIAAHTFRPPAGSTVEEISHKRSHGRHNCDYERT